MLFAAAALLTGVAAEPVDFSVDLYLVGNNHRQIKSLDWLDKPEEGESVEPILRPIFKAFDQSKTSYVLLDGGECSVFPSKEAHTIACVARKFSSYNSMTQSVTVKGKTKTQVLARTDTTETDTFWPYAKPVAEKCPGYVAQCFLHFPDTEPHRYLAFQDLNSYRQVLKDGKSQDLETLPNTLAMSDDSTYAANEFIRKNGFDFKGWSICIWGLPQPHSVSFPPAGVVGHYKLYHQGDHWGVRFLEYLGHPTDTNRFALEARQ